MTVVLLQLPVPDHAGRDLPLAAACLENAWKRRHPATAPDCRFIHPPHGLINQGSDQAILSWLVEAAADLVAWSLYLWNRERSQWLAARLRELRPGVQQLAGGPEVQANRLPLPAAETPSPDLPEFDWLVAGPGEEPFVALLHWLLSGQSPGPAVPPLYRSRREAESIEAPDPAGASPWLDGTLAMASAAVHLETVRGCPNSCTYCHYGKHYPRLLFLPECQVRAIVETAASRGVRELYLMDPSFSQRPRLDEFLEKLAAWNQGRLRIHTELRLEDISPARAKLLARAGISSVEAGLQSINPQALAAVGRTWNQPRFEAGAHALRDEGIRVSTGIILGLPHDGPDQIRATMDYVDKLGLGESAEAYPLAVLPGTGLRAQASGLGLEFMPRPPYYLLASPWIDQTGIMDCLDYAGGLWNRENQAPVQPGIAASHRLKSVVAFQALLAEPAALPRVVTFRLASGLLAAPGAPSRLCRSGRDWRLAAPHSECRLVLDLPLPASIALPPLQDAFRGPDHLIERMRYYQADPQSCWSCRLFVAAATPGQALAWLDLPHRDQAELVIDLAGSPDRPALLDFLLAHDWEQLPFVHAGPGREAELSAYYEGLDNLVE